MQETEWIMCPICKNKTRIKIRDDTILINFPLYCPKCKQESVVSIQKLNTIIMKEPDVVIVLGAMPLTHTPHI